MMLSLDRAVPVPLGEQLQAQLKLLISSAQLRPGEQLPTVNELAATLQINPNTVAAAYRALAEAGYLSQNRRAGTRVAAAPPQAPAETLALHLGRRFARDLGALGLSLAQLLPLLAAGSALGMQRPLRIAVLGRTPMEAFVQAERARAVLGQDFDCVPQTLPTYRSLEHHLTLVSPELLASLAPETFIAEQHERHSADFPAGAD